MALLILISSVFILNSKGVINEGTINDLHVAAYFAELIGSQSSIWAPKFIWLLRDFCLDLVDDSGSPITAREYMENTFQTEYRYARSKAKFEKVKEILYGSF